MGRGIVFLHAIYAVFLLFTATSFQSAIAEEHACGSMTIGVTVDSESFMTARAVGIIMLGHVPRLTSLKIDLLNII